jgi:hypothetical protein
MTLRLSSACSNQLSYRPDKLPRNLLKILAKQKSGGKGTRTPDIQLAKLALYQLSYAPVEIVDGEWLIVDGDPSSTNQILSTIKRGELPEGR